MHNMTKSYTRDIFWSARDKKGRYLLNNESQNRDYVFAMADAILRELQQNRHCWLFDRSLADASIATYDLLAITEVYCHVFNRKPRLTIPMSNSIQEMNRDYYTMILDVLYEVCQPTKANRPICDADIVKLENKRNTLNEEIRSLEKKRDLLVTEIRGMQDTIAKLNDEAKAVENDIADSRQMIANAQAKAEKVIREAEVKAEQIIQGAETKAQTIKDSMIHTVAEEISHEDNTSYSITGITKDEVENQIRGLENCFRESMNKYRDDIQTTLHDYRNSLYSTEYSYICDAYQRLYRFATSRLEKYANRKNEADSEDNADSMTQQDIRDVQAGLLRLVGRFERAFEMMGFTLIKPENGSTYNCNEHVADNAEDDGTLETNIQQCLCPGIKAGMQVIQKAIVDIM